MFVQMLICDQSNLVKCHTGYDKDDAAKDISSLMPTQQPIEATLAASPGLLCLCSENRVLKDRDSRDLHLHSPIHKPSWQSAPK